MGVRRERVEIASPTNICLGGGGGVGLFCVFPPIMALPMFDS